MSAPTRLTAAEAAAALTELGVDADPDAGVAEEFGEHLLTEIVEGYLAALNAGEAAQTGHVRYEFGVLHTGRRGRFLRIMQWDADRNRQGGSVHAFLDTTDGSLHMAGGLQGPARRRDRSLMPRYQLADRGVRTTLFAKLATGNHRHGGYLYADSLIA